MDDIKKPRPDTILELSRSLYTSITFFIGTELDIFTLLDQGPLDVKQAASCLKMDPKFVERLLYALAASRLITHQNGLFKNTEETSHYLVRGKLSYLGDHVMVNPVLKRWILYAGTELTETLNSGAAVNQVNYSSMTYDDLLRAFRGTLSVAYKAGDELAEIFDLNPYRSLIDVAGASGGLAAAIKQRYPKLDVAVSDLPSVTPVSKTLLKEQRAPEIDVIDWELLNSPCSRRFDVAVVRALIQVISAHEAAQALNNIHESLNPGGLIILLGHVMEDSKISPAEEVIWYLFNLNWEDQAGFYTFSDIENLAEQAGFVAVNRERLPNGDGVVYAKKSL